MTQLEYKRIIMTIFLTLLILILIFVVFNQYNVSKKTETLVLDKVITTVKRSQHELTTFYSKMDAQLDALNGKIFRSFLHNRDKTDNLTSLFKSMAKSDPTIMQVRFLNSEGMEALRLDRHEFQSEPFMKNKEELQDKSKRRYFIRSKHAKSKKPLYSHLDLNMENSVIEVPYKPTIRAMLPVYSQDKFQGVLVINYFAMKLLEGMMKNPFYDTIISDDEGFVLTHYDQNKSWGRYLEKSSTIKSLYSLDPGKDFQRYENFVVARLVSPVQSFYIFLKFNQSYLDTIEEETGARIFQEVSLFFFVGILLTLFITQRLKKILNANDQIQKAERLFRSTFETAAVGIAHVSLNGTWMRVNNRLCDLLGYKEAELKKLTFQDITHKDDLDTDLLYVERMLNGEIQTYKMEKRYIKKDNTILWAILTVSLVKDTHGKPDYFISVVNDISDKKALEIERTKFYEREHKIHKEMDEYLNLIDKYIITSSTDLNGVITTTSDAFCHISGYKRQELIGKHHNIVRHEDMPSELYRDLWKSIQDDKVWSGEIKNKTKNGEAYWVYATISPIFDSDGIKTGYTAIRQLITAQKNLEESQDVIVSQSRLSAMGEVLSVIAHQWRQPLTTISMGLGKLRVMMELDQDKVDLEARFNALDDNIDQLSKTINDFRIFFDPHQSKKLKPLDQILHATFIIFNNNFIVHEIDIDYTIDQSIKDKLFSSQLEQALLSIVTNALESLNQCEASQKYIKITATKLENSINIIIDDNGVGIVDEDLPYIFDPYFSSKKELNGKGIGLYITKIIIENTLKGSVSVSNRQEGVRVSILLPLDEAS